MWHLGLMEKSSPGLSLILIQLTHRARGCKITDTEWAKRAGIRKETLSRLRGRTSCDFATLQSLARTLGANIGVIDDHVLETTADGRFPAHVDRDYEEKLADLCASKDLDADHWRRAGPSFFMAGLAVMVASAPDFDRRSLLELAEQLHAGSTQVGVFALWLKASPVRPSRFLPVIETVRRAA